MSWTPDSIKSESIGEGNETLVLLHGWGRQRGDFRSLAKVLSPYRRCLLLDLPGFGESPKPDGDWGTTEYADAVVSFLESQGIKSYDLLGHSFGGRIALRIASKNPSELEKLILVGSHGVKIEMLPEKKLRVLAIKVIRNWCNFLDQQFKTNLYDDWFTPKFASRDFLAAGELRKILVKTVNEDQSEDAKAIKAQTLLIYGDKDEETPVNLGRRLEELISDSRLEILPEKDHYPFLDIGAHLCAFLIRPFLVGESEKKKEAA